jgi:Rps23 Pro-64 3,4-dihydroxylase Tpa1-like proline 4-hydroxylase
MGGGNPLVATFFSVVIFDYLKKLSLHAEYPQQKYFYFYDSFPCSQNVNFVMSILKLEQTSAHIVELLITLLIYNQR